MAKRRDPKTLNELCLDELCATAKATGRAVWWSPTGLVLGPVRLTREERRAAVERAQWAADKARRAAR